MDVLTQAALGAVVGELTLGRELGYRGAAWGLFFGILPDLDVVALPFLDPAAGIRWHRGLSHSILIMILAPALLAKPLSRCRWARGASPGKMAALIFWAWSTHVLIDCFTTYGTQIFEPFSDYRAAMNLLFIVDPLFTLPLVVGLIWALRLPGTSGLRRRVMWGGVACSLFYLSLAFAMKCRAETMIARNVAGHLNDARVVQVSPGPFNTILWRGLIETNDSYYLTYWSPFDQGEPQFTRLLKQRDLTNDYGADEVLAALQWFSRGHWVARTGENGELVIVDLRLPEIRDPDRKTVQPIFQWHLSRDSSGTIRAPMERPTGINYPGAMKILSERIVGHSKNWDALAPF